MVYPDVREMIARLRQMMHVLDTMFGTVPYASAESDQALRRMVLLRMAEASMAIETWIDELVKSTEKTT